VRVRVNGEARDLPDGVTVAELLSLLGLRASQVAVEVNLEIVARASHRDVRLADGDVVEIVGFVGGG
jgi:sulfur carrier protein